MDLQIFASGSSGNASMVSSGRGRLLIDAGISMRRTAAAVRESGGDLSAVAGIILTHAHSDHIGGIKMLSKYHRLPIYCTDRCADELCRYVPESAAYIKVIEAGSEFECAGLGITAFPTSHDSPGSVGYALTDGFRRLAYVTDLGYVSPEVESAVLGADTAVLEANHDLGMLMGGPYPYYLKERIRSRRGHLSNDDCALLAVKLAQSGAGRIILAHLSAENNSPRTALHSVGTALAEAGFDNVALSVARRSECSEKVAV